MPKKVVLL